MSLINEQLKTPFLLSPASKDYLWGGDRLNTEFGKNIPMSPLAETWECSTHPDGASVIASGKFSGTNLQDFIKQYPQVLGTRHEKEKELPILVKFIDAKRDLSVQVHPSDEYAKEYENGQLGKSEMWYIVDAQKEAKIVYGFEHDADAETIKNGLESGEIEKYLHFVPVKKNELYFVNAGTVHAIGAGALIAEIQENSNLTYRLYDYNRTDKHGKKRELHIKKALEVLQYEGCNNLRQPMRVLKYERGIARETLCRCKYFEVGRMLVNTEVLHRTIVYRSDELSFRVLMCLDGCGSLRFENDSSTEIIDFYKGDTIFVPANSTRCNIHGKTQFLDIRA